MADKIKLLVAVLLVIAGVAGFYLFADAPTVVRVLLVIGGLVLAGVVAGLSAPGRQFFRFALDSRDEAKKVVWPTRKETVQMTGVGHAPSGPWRIGRGDGPAQCGVCRAPRSDPTGRL